MNSTIIREVPAFGSYFLTYAWFTRTFIPAVCRAVGLSWSSLILLLFFHSGPAHVCIINRLDFIAGVVTIAALLRLNLLQDW
jgi:hypothetical protein